MERRRELADAAERTAERRRAPYEVINAGVWGYTSYQGLARFKELVAFEPDIILVSFGGNDTHQVQSRASK